MRKNDCKPYTIKAKELEYMIDRGDIQIPSYQRGIVWTDAMQKDLIKSIKDGYPFGSLLIYKYMTGDKTWLLIDGLQRSTSIFRFIKNPAEFFNDDDIDEELIDKIVALVDINQDIKDIKQRIKQIIKEWVLDHKTSDEVRNMRDFKCAQKIIHEFPILLSNDSEIYERNLNYISETIRPIFDNYKKLCTYVEEKEIPYIEITGDDSNLADIFYKINDRGKRLDKQNKFAATWNTNIIKLQDQLSFILEVVRKRYDEIERSGTSIYNYDSITFYNKKELDVFELAYGFGKYIGIEFPTLFRVKKDMISVDSIGFTLINACLGGTKETLSRMNEQLVKKYDDEDINQFIIDIISCIRYVDSQLAIVTKFKSNKRMGKSVLHTEYQIVSMIASIFKLKYSKTENGIIEYDLYHVNKNWNHYDLKLRKNLIKRYVFDILNNNWSAHGDNELDDIVINNYDIYTRDISETAFRNGLSNWYEKEKLNQLVSKASEVSSPKEIDKILLNLLYVKEFSAAKQLDESKFDIEHLAPKKLLEHILNRFYGELKLPIGSFGNLCLLPESANRKKKDRTIYDDTQYVNEIIKKDLSLNELEKQYTFTEKQDLSWLNNDDLSMQEVSKLYYEFIDHRFALLTDKIINTLYDETRSNQDILNV